MNKKEAEHLKRQLEKQRDSKLKQARRNRQTELDSIWQWYERELANIERKTK